MTGHKQPVSVLVVIYTAPDETTDMTTSHLTGGTTGRSTKPPKNGDPAADYATGSGQALDIQVLLLERADHPGYWQSVTGSIEAHESLRQTALREVLEETGIAAQQQQLTDWDIRNIYEIYPQWRYRYPPAITHNTEHVFGLQLPQRVAVQLAPREHLNCQWLAWQDAAEKVFSPSNRAAILELPQRLQTKARVQRKSE
jgi:dATP pyrophosphohydrolase